MQHPTPKQSFIGIWFHDDNLSADQLNKMTFNLNRTFYYYRIITDISEFITYIADKTRLVTKIFLIISKDTLYESLMNLILKYQDLFEKTYVYLPAENCTALFNTCFTTACRRILFEEIFKDIFQYNIKENSSNKLLLESDRIPLSVHVYDLKRYQSIPIRHITKESLKFLCFMVMTKILLRISYDEKNLSEMWMECRHICEENNPQLDHIDKLAVNYEESKAIEYYTGSSCLSRVVNQACHTENMRQLFTFRFFVENLHEQLKELDNYRRQNNDNIVGQIVFRGKPLSRTILQQIIDNEGNLISFNGFLSTTLDRNVASSFAGENIVNTESRSVLFKLHIDESIAQSYANIAPCSTKPDESECLFTLGTVWRIQSVDLNVNPCEIELTSYNALESPLDNIFNRYTEENCSLLSLGNILHDIGEDEEAEWFYRKMLDQEPSVDETTRGILYYKIGTIRFEKEDYPVALDSFEKSADLLQPSTDDQEEKTLPSPQPICLSQSEHLFLTIYNNIAQNRHKKGHLDAARDYYEKALEQEGSNFERANVHNNFGLYHYECGSYSEAYEHHNEAINLIDESHSRWAEFKKNFIRAKKRYDHLQR